MRLLILVAVSTLLLSCQSYDPVRVEEDFGNSVRQMKKQQTYSDAVSVESDQASPNRLDGPSAVRTIERYKTKTRTQQSLTGPTDGMR